MIRREFLAGLTGLSALAAAPAISFAQTPMNLGQQWDVIVIGSGLAGLSAALSASENGADRILVIEKLPVLGGHSRLSTGSFLAVSPKRLEPLGIHISRRCSGRNDGGRRRDRQQRFSSAFALSE